MIKGLAITVSNRAAAGVYADRSGPVLIELLRSAGCDVVDGPLVIPDGEAVEQVLRDSVTAGYDVAVTTGGTGLTPTDLTPEMTRRVLDREIPGIAEALRTAGAAAGIPSAILSRGLAGVAGAHADRQPARVIGRRSGRDERAAADPGARGRSDSRRRSSAPASRIHGRPGAGRIADTA